MNTENTRPIPFWQDPVKRGIFFQVLFLGLVSLVTWYLYSNTQANLARQNIATGFGFLSQESSFEIGESLFSFSAEDSFFRAISVGLTNSIFVSVVGIFFALLLGTFAGVSSLSQNLALKRIALTYIEITRNLPLLLQLFFWYSLMTEGLPGINEAYQLGTSFFLSNRGLSLPFPEGSSTNSFIGIGLMLALLGSIGFSLMAKKKRDLTGKQLPVLPVCLGMLIGFPTIAWLIQGMPQVLEYPKLALFNFEGGATISPELTALLLGLIFYTGAFMAEIVRSGILAIDNGQWEAAKALGLSNAKTLQLIILPQSMRVIIPPMISQMLNLTKNSSLAVAIGYPDIVSVANTTMNQTGQAIEAIVLLMGFYLTFSISTSVVMNWYNKKIQYKGR